MAFATKLCGSNPHPRTLQILDARTGQLLTLENCDVQYLNASIAPCFRNEKFCGAPRTILRVVSYDGFSFANFGVLKLCFNSNGELIYGLWGRDMYLPYALLQFVYNF